MQGAWNTKILENDAKSLLKLGMWNPTEAWQQVHSQAATDHLRLGNWGLYLP